jgi:5-bromo-4-chloroindolyl phosphate hydrolysis protein
LKIIGIGFLVRKRPKKRSKRRIKGTNNMSETRTVINQIKKQIEQNEMLIEAIERFRKQQLQAIKKEILALKTDNQ